MVMPSSSFSVHPDLRNQNTNKNKGTHVLACARASLETGARVGAAQRSDRSVRVTQFRGDAHYIICKQNVPPCVFHICEMFSSLE